MRMILFVYVGGRFDMPEHIAVEAWENSKCGALANEQTFLEPC